MGANFLVAAVLAHEGGWDEILLVGGPIVVIIVVLAVAKRRVDAQAAAHAPEGGEPSESAGDAPERSDPSDDRDV